jgi:hypothetical protein
MSKTNHLVQCRVNCSVDSSLTKEEAMELVNDAILSLHDSAIIHIESMSTNVIPVNFIED